MTQISVLDHGYVELVDHMGDDLTVVNAARVSFNKRSTYFHATWDAYGGPEGYVINPVCHGGDWCEGDILREGDRKLLKFLATGGHWSPFSHPQLMFEIKAPIMVINQWRKHRIGMAYTDEDEVAFDAEGHNEASMRYIGPSDFYIPLDWRSAPANKKQGSGPNVDTVLSDDCRDTMRGLVENSFRLYKTIVDDGIAPEQARLMLPAYALYTTMYWTTSLFGVTRFLNLRQKSDAQYEIRAYANAIEPIVRELFPESAEVLLDTNG